VFVRKFGVKARPVLTGTALVLAALALAGCNVFKGTPPTTYDLSTPPPPQVAPRGISNAQILIPEPTALAALNSDRILVSTGSRVSYYPDAQWPDRLPKLFQTKMIAAFEQSHRARAVGRPGEGLSIDYQIQSDVRTFGYDTQAHMARVEVFTKVVNDRTGRVVASQVFGASAPVAADSADAVVAGLDQATQAILADMVAWSLKRF
jgi:cholesterol transport system auxiliary component